MSIETINSISSFDSIAESYDKEFEDNLVTKSIRPVITESFIKYFRAGQHILELNCGTGTDALMLAEKEIHVTAIDSSEKMIQQAKLKAHKRAIRSVDFRVMDFENIETLGENKFDGAFSNFGGLNCSRSLSDVLENLSKLLKPQSPLIVCLLNKLCLWEIGSFLLRGNVRTAFRRLHSDGTDAKLSASSIRVWYYSPYEFAKILSPWFTVKEIYGINILSPLPNSHSFVSKFPRLSLRLLNVDEKIRRLVPFYMLGDHFVIEARRK